MKKILTPRILCEYDIKGMLLHQEYEYTFKLKVDEVVTGCSNCPFGYKPQMGCVAPKCMFDLFDEETHYHMNMEYYCDKERD